MKSNRNPFDEKSNRKGGMPYWEKMQPKKESRPKKEDTVRAKKSPKEHGKEKGWDDVAKWYEKMVGDEGSDYHQHVIVPALMKRMGDLGGKKVLDLCCGQGFLGRILLEAGADAVVGVDASAKLIAAARERSAKLKNVEYVMADACAPGAWADGSSDAVVCLLAVHDVKHLAGLFDNARAALAADGRFFLVMMHPCFRIPQHTHWGWDDEQRMQYRRVDHYGNEREISITTHPGKNTGEQTAFYHRPLASYLEALGKSGLAVCGCEELITHRRSQKGPRSEAEHIAAEEFPMFMMLEVMKMPHGRESR